MAYVPKDEFDPSRHFREATNEEEEEYYQRLLYEDEMYEAYSTQQDIIDMSDSKEAPF